MNWSAAAVVPRYLRVCGSPAQSRDGALPSLPDVGRVGAALHTVEQVNQLTAREARALHGKQVDELAVNRLTAATGTRWLATSQECHYRPPRPDSSMAALDVAILMVDNRPPLPYEVVGTALRSPEGWGADRMRIADGWTPARGSVTSFQLALIVNHIYAQLHGYRFYLENPCPRTFRGVNASIWAASMPPHARTKPLSDAMLAYLAKHDICPSL